MAIGISLVSFVLLCHVWDSRVRNDITQVDEVYIKKFLAGIKPVSHDNWQDEVRFIIEVKWAVLNHSLKRMGIPKGKQREPRDLWESGYGNCYDRSRVLEKILRYSGFRTRHVSIYEGYRKLFIPHSRSHATTEVLINKRWVRIDTLPSDIYLDNHIDVRGLYSRHGGFYPPYNHVPDINWGEFLWNFRL